MGHIPKPNAYIIGQCALIEEGLHSFLPAEDYDVHIELQDSSILTQRDLVIFIHNNWNDLFENLEQIDLLAKLSRLVLIGPLNDDTVVRERTFSHAAAILDYRITRPKLIAALNAVMAGVTVRDDACYWTPLRLCAEPRQIASLPKPSESFVSRIADGSAPCSFSRREEDVLALLSDGCSNKLIARKLGITESTIKIHVKNILRKLNADNRTQAALWAKSHLYSRSETDVIEIRLDEATGEGGCPSGAEKARRNQGNCIASA